MYEIPCLCAYASSATAGLFDFGRLLLVFIPGAFYTGRPSPTTLRQKNRSVVAAQLSGRWRDLDEVRFSGLLLSRLRLCRAAEKLNACARVGILGLILLLNRGGTGYFFAIFVSLQT